MQASFYCLPRIPHMKWASNYLNFNSLRKRIITRQRCNQGEANGQLPISFGDLPIVIFISKFLPIEILLFQSCLLIFELDSNCIFSIRLSLTYILCLFFLRRIKKSRRITPYILTYVFFSLLVYVYVYTFIIHSLYYLLIFELNC